MKLLQCSLLPAAAQPAKFLDTHQENQAKEERKQKASVLQIEASAVLTAQILHVSEALVHLGANSKTKYMATTCHAL